MDDTNGSVSITLKDVYQATQTLEKSLGDALNTLNMTMLSIKNHLDQLDSRNAAADQIHKEHAERIRKLEGIQEAANPVTTHSDFEIRIRSLERFKYTLLGAVVIVNAALGFIEYLLVHRR